MTEKKPMSRRELWLVSLLPAALVLIVSTGLPGPGEEIATAERRLEQMTSAAAQRRLSDRLREATAELAEARSAIEELDLREEALELRLAAARAPREVVAPKRRPPMAYVLDELASRLEVRGIRVLAMDPVRSGSTPAAPFVAANPFARRSRAKARARGEQVSAARTTSATAARWSVTVAATWPDLMDALRDEDSFPEGLGLLALDMEPARRASSLHSWQLTVSEVATP